MSRFLVLVNPASHGGRSNRRWKRLAELLPEGDFVVLSSVEEARERARTATGYETVVACGGDGTVRAVAEGVLENADDRLKLGVLYAGTSPDFCHAQGIPTKPADAIRLLRGGTFRELPVLTANGRPFLCSLNLGVGAAVAAAANRLRPTLGDGLGTFIALVGSLLRAGEYDLALNGEQAGPFLHVLVTRIAPIAGGLRLALPKLTDDEFAVWSVRRPGVLGWPRLLWRLYRGKPYGAFRVVHGSLRLDAAETLPVEYDGDPHGALPVEIRFAARRLKVVCP